MNKKQKITVAFAALTIVLSFLIWIVYGGEFFTKTRILVDRKDNLFPDLIYREWIPKFILGLDLSLAITGIVVIAAGILLFIFRQKKSVSEFS